MIPPILMFNVQCYTPGRFALSSFFYLHFFFRAKTLLLVHLYLSFSLFSLQFLFLFCAQISAFVSRRDNPKNQQVHLIIIHTTRGQPRPCFDTGFWVFLSCFLFHWIFLGHWYNSHTPRTTDCVHYFMGFHGTRDNRTWEYGSWKLGVIGHWSWF